MQSVLFLLLTLAFGAQASPQGSPTPTPTPAPVCITQSQPNPIFDQYPDKGTGTANGTVAIIPIDYDVARSIVPAQYPILRNAYRSLIPWLPRNKYPVCIVVDKPPLSHPILTLLPLADRCIFHSRTTMILGKAT